MIERILPAKVASVAQRELGRPDDLLAAESATLGRAVDRRVAEFAAGRRCARAALERLGVASVAIPRGVDREPIWPAGIVGSITHCRGYVAAAVARSGRLHALGIDAELHAPLPAGVLSRVALGSELAWLDRADSGICWDRVLFSAKESIFKAWHPLARRWLGFEDAEVSFDPVAGRFQARLLVPGPIVAARPLRALEGRFTIIGEHVLSAVAVPADAC